MAAGPTTHHSTPLFGQVKSCHQSGGKENEVSMPLKPYATWVRRYPLLADDQVARIRSLLADRVYMGTGPRAGRSLPAQERA
jgi:hypothetical protein